MSSTLRRMMMWLGLLALLLLFFLIYSYWRWNRDITGTGPYASTQPECGHDARNMVASSFMLTTGDTLAVPGHLTNIPEYHDCQRFVKTDGSYGPLAAIYVSYRLNALIDSVVKMDSTGNYIVGKTTSGVATASIYSHDGDYDDLGIKKGFNCLMLYQSEGKYEAQIRPVASETACNDNGFNPRTSGYAALEVRPITNAITIPPGDATYPSVARWDWDSEHKIQYIGMRCRTAWCEIGKKGFTGSPADLASGAPTSGGEEEAVRRRVKGWYDDQALDVPATSGVGYTMGTGAVAGKIFPHPKLREYSVEDYTGHWKTTGYVSMANANAYYKKKFNFAQTSAGGDFKDMNTLEMCYGTKGQCGINSLAYTRCGFMNGFWSIFLRRWWAQITPAGGGTPMQKCVVRRTHDGVTMGVPGTARWRWLADDPTTWEECAGGCCEVESGS